MLYRLHGFDLLFLQFGLNLLEAGEIGDLAIGLGRRLPMLDAHDAEHRLLVPHFTSELLAQSVRTRRELLDPAEFLIEILLILSDPRTQFAEQLLIERVFDLWRNGLKMSQRLILQLGRLNRYFVHRLGLNLNISLYGPIIYRPIKTDIQI